MTVPAGLEGTCPMPDVATWNSPCLRDGGQDGRFYWLQVGTGAYYGRTGEHWRFTADKDTPNDRLLTTAGCSP
jgi:hypothetical protein